MFAIDFEKIDPAGITTIMNAVMKEGYTLQDFSNVSDTEMEAIYATALNLLNQHQFSKAQALAEFLCNLDQYESRYWLLLGISRQQQKKWEDAVGAYNLAGINDCENPLPPLYAAECHLALKNYTDAIKAAKAAIFWAGDNPQMVARKQRANMILEHAQSKRENS